MTESILHDTLNLSSQAIIITDEKGRTIFLNKKAELLWKIPHKITNEKRSFIDYLDPSWLSQHRSQSEKLNFSKLLQKIPFQQEIKCLCKTTNGERFPLIISFDYLPNGRAFIIGRDWEDNKKNSDYEFLRKLNHEIRGSLNSIIGYSTLLCDKQKLEPNTKKFIDKIAKNGKKLNDLMDATSFYFNLGYNKIKPQITEVSLSDLIDKILKEKTHDLSVQTKIPGKVNKIKTDKEMIYHILNQLVDNSIKYTESGALSLNLQADPVTHDPVSIVIKDSGIGIKRDKTDDIFKPFIKIDSGVFNKKRGHGLGLATVKSICDLFGYQLKIDSKEGEGTKVTLILSTPNTTSTK